MDRNTDVLEVQCGVGNFNGFRHLTPLQRDPVDGEELKNLWEKIQTQDYAFDDRSLGRVDYFLCQVADMNSEFLKIGTHGLFMINQPWEGGTANIHFVVWDRDYSLYREREVVQELFDWLFFEKKVHRIQAMVPNYNHIAQRFTLSCGCKFEGEMQEAVLWKGKYYNVQIFGMTEQQYRKRRERMHLQ